MQTTPLNEEIKRKIEALQHSPRRRRSVDWGENAHRLAVAVARRWKTRA